jgi:hypothetical protein
VKRKRPQLALARKDSYALDLSLAYTDRMHRSYPLPEKAADGRSVRRRHRRIGAWNADLDVDRPAYAPVQVEAFPRMDVAARTMPAPAPAPTDDGAGAPHLRSRGRRSPSPTEEGRAILSERSGCIIWTTRRCPPPPTGFCTTGRAARAAIGWLRLGVHATSRHARRCEYPFLGLC